MAISIDVEFSFERGGAGLIATVSTRRFFWPETTTRYVCHDIDPLTGGAWSDEAAGRSPSHSLILKLNEAALSAARLAGPPPGGPWKHLDALVGSAPRSLISRLRWRLPSMHGPAHRRERDARKAKDRS